MLVELAFFDGDLLLTRGAIRCGNTEAKEFLTGTSGHMFEITHQYGFPACPLAIVCSVNGSHLYEAALSVGVHNSEDWESINLGNVHTLAFRCSGVDEGAA